MRPGDRPLVRRARYYGRRAGAWARRATPVGLAVRGVVWVAGFAGLMLTAGPVLDPVGGLALALVLASLATGWPGTVWVSICEYGTAVLLAVAVGQGALSLVEVGAVAALLYLHHTTAALGAQVRTDALVSAAVVRHWLTRAGATLGVSAVVGTGVVALPAMQPAWPASGYVVAGGLAAVVAAVALAYLVLRRPEST